MLLNKKTGKVLKRREKLGKVEKKEISAKPREVLPTEEGYCPTCDWKVGIDDWCDNPTCPSGW